ncbi:hypothetical protein ILUMI_09079 [Ignelater luminosus]|uniref:Uncharacterized protein n=1 Tax=Ignelater luminosus TaxID=2038154 RepID=A0A8K0D0G4_IGNLU|nr:hypothetical protein ILUMI_09079 [Ignelater luminosus]
MNSRKQWERYIKRKGDVNVDDLTQFLNEKCLLMEALDLEILVKKDIGATPADLVYGVTLRLSADLIEQSTAPNPQPNLSCVTKLKTIIRNIMAPPIARHNKVVSHTPKYLRSSSCVFRGEKYYMLDIQGKPENISIDRLKPAYMEATDSAHMPPQAEPKDATEHFTF